MRVCVCLTTNITEHELRKKKASKQPIKTGSNVLFQGQFSINLIGTGLKVAEATKWTSQGNYVSVKVHRSEVSLSVAAPFPERWITRPITSLCRGR